MTCPDFKDLMMGYIDNELDGQQKELFENHLKSCKQCTEEVQDFKSLKSITDDIKMSEPEDKVWENYWSNVYNRCERSLGWIFLSVSAILLLTFGGFKLIEAIIEDPAIDKTLKAGLLIGIAAIAILLVSILRERLHIRNKDRYKDVRR